MSGGLTRVRVAPQTAFAEFDSAGPIGSKDMSYMEKADQFAGSKIQELSFDEIASVDGAGVSPGTAMALRFVGRVALGAGLAGLAVGVGIEAYIYFSNN